MKRFLPTKLLLFFVTLGVLAELVAEDAEASGGVAEASGNRGGREMLDEIGSKSLVLSVGRVPWVEERLSDSRYLFLFTFQ